MLGRHGRWFLLALLLTATHAAALAAEPAGKVLYASGAVTARDAGGAVRFLGKGTPVHQGETVTTGKRGFALLEMVDEGKMTLRPSSELHIERYEAREEGESAAMELLRGGLRALTGLFAKRRPDSYRLKATVATIGIRGTEFDVRICEAGECGDQQAQAGDAGRDRAAWPLAGRVVLQRGVVHAEAAGGGSTRSLAKGSRIYAGDTVVTGRGSLAAIVFRDDSRAVVQADSRFSIDHYDYEPQQEKPSAFFRLVRGGLRTLTGLIGQRNADGVRVATSTATIGIRGTGFDVFADQACEDGASAAGVEDANPQSCTYVNVWEGSVDANGTALAEGDTGFVAEAETAAATLDETPAFIAENDAPRPDALEVDLEALFGAESPDTGDPGVYVSVTDGQTVVSTPAGEVVVARGEAARINPGDGDITRLSGQPLFMTDDPYPTPSRFDEAAERSFDLFGPEFGGIDEGDRLECRIN